MGVRKNVNLHARSSIWKDRRVDAADDLPVVMPSPSRLSAWLWGVLALLVGLAFTLAAHRQQQQGQLAAQSTVRTELADKTFAALKARLAAADAMLCAVQTLFLASDEVTQTEFANFYTNLRPREQFPSLLALAYAQREADATGEHYVMRWVEPREGNDAIVGLKVDTQPNNLRALQASQQSDQATLSAPFRLVQESGRGESDDGITLRLPVFTTGAPPLTLEQRSQRSLGSVALSFRVSQLVGNLLASDVRRQLRLQLSDVTDATHALDMFDSAPAASNVAGDFRFERRLAYGGRVWNFVMQSGASGAYTSDWRQSGLPAGLLASVLFALLAYSVVSTRQRALELGWRMSQRYRESEERFRTLNELLPVLVVLAEVESGRITYANRASRERLGESGASHLLFDLFEDAALRDQLQNGDDRASGRIEAQLRTDAGVPFWASVVISRVELSGLGKLLMVASDISDERQLTEQLSHQASHDMLTDLYNRREFERRLHRALATRSPDSPLLVLLYLDLDQFKLINDTSGHVAGDQLLTQLSALMRNQLRSTDVLARLGGDEFGVLLFNIAGQPEAERIAESLRRCMDGYVFIWEQRSHMISASIGGVVIDHSGVPAKDLLAQADTACYMAKETGRNRVHFYSPGDDQTVLRDIEMNWANRLRLAIDERCLYLVYQEVWPLPLSDRRDASIEILLRFREASSDLAVPGAFLPAAERYGLMPVLDRWVIETTLANFERLHLSASRVAMVAINLSGASIDDEALAGQIIGLLQRYQIEPSRVCFEITETVAVRNLSQVARCMGLLRNAGCRIALDDFGAGMSSFTYLKNLPLDIIKIDGSFVRDMLVDPVSYLMVKAVTDIGHRLDLEVIAEWVDDAATVQALTELGVDRVQGFSLHRPELALFNRD